MKTLNVSLPESLEEFVQGKVTSGGYSSASEVVREGLRLLQQYDAERMRMLRLAIQEGLNSPLGSTLKENTGAALAARGEKRLKKAERPQTR